MTTSLQEQRFAKAKVSLAKWLRKQKMANTKVKKLKAKIKYYEKQLVGASK